ncbi:hypothetical protein LRP49_02585 [Enterovibrio sp. ZSDZ35]|uniref:Uncharacterized protein n=1 Tax=Enterovibrio qingdaonensis TaxID=2899818 RepID=A0ABT5QID0_9GAMM|nr:hypothetical protein [Enterovibrio sp. ZSDZ35]MDD1780076.1 hypothetical protein [Enterovibrio sp. ZSDZ35]
MRATDKTLYTAMGAITLLFVSILSVNFQSAYASPVGMTLQDSYAEAAYGDTGSNDQVLKAVENLLLQYPKDPLLTAYYGSTLAIKARDSWAPWNRSKYTKEGLNYLNKALRLLDEDSYSKPYSGLNEGLFIQSLAAITFVSMPDFLQQEEKGYDMLQGILDSENFQYYPFEPRAWIHRAAVKAALSKGDKQQALEWAIEMYRLAPTHPYTLEAMELVEA